MTVIMALMLITTPSPLRVSLSQICKRIASGKGTFRPPLTRMLVTGFTDALRRPDLPNEFRVRPTLHTYLGAKVWCGAMMMRCVFCACR
jgi:hypothetical protein